MQTGGEAIQGVFEASQGLEEPTSQETETSEQPEGSIGELSVREITELSLEEEKAKLADGDNGQGVQEKAQAQANEPKQAKASKGKNLSDSGQNADPLGAPPAPARLTEQGKQIFNQLPPPLKAATARLFKDVERQSHQHWQQLSAATQAANGITQGVRSYLMERPHLVEAGYTEGKMVSELLAAHMKLERPETKLSEYARIGSQIGLTPEEYAQLGAALGYQPGSVPSGSQGDISNHPRVRALEETVLELQQNLNPVVSSYQRTAQMQFEKEVDSTASEIDAVRNEKDHLGKIRYPELFNDDFLESVKPLVVGLRGSFPGISWGAATRAAYYEALGADKFAAVAQAKRDIDGNSNQPNPTRLPSNSQQLERATLAAVSVRGKSSPSQYSQGATDDEAPPEVLRRGTRAIAEWALQRERQKAGRL